LAQNLLISLHIFRHVYSHDCHFIRLRPRLGSFAPNRPMAIPSYPLARNVLASFWSRTALLALKKKKKIPIIIIIIYRTSRCYQIYDFILFSASRRYSASRPCPLTAIFGLAASPPHGNRFSIHFTANVDIFFIFLMPHGEINFLFASRRMSILFFSRRFTAKSIFYSPHGECRFYRASRR
jgi:hypothetical protein